MENVIKNLLETIISHGDRGAVVPFFRINDLKNNMSELKNSENKIIWIDRMVKHITNAENKFIPSDIDFIPRSLISVIMPSPKVKLRFNYYGKLLYCVVPPHYTNWYSNNDRVLTYIRDYLKSYNLSVEKIITIPQKMLAVHCGLGLYGRNNICYNNEFGSYMQIMTYISDLHCENQLWYPLKRMDICSNCNNCIISCPTGAIENNQKLVNTNKCITFFDEIPWSLEPFPNWINNNAFNSIIGCETCQVNCPANEINKNNVIIGVEFTDNETIEILNNNLNKPYSAALNNKLENTGIAPEYTKVIPRNLNALIKKICNEDI